MTRNHFPDWRDYEKQILKLIRNSFPENAKVIFNDKIRGQASKKLRQIDVSVRINNNGEKRLGIIECKHLGKKINITHIDALYGKLKDTNADFAFIYTSLGFTQGAGEYAEKMKIIAIETVPYDFLKDYGFVSANSIEDVFLQEINYASVYCKKCTKLNIYEIKIVRGFAEFEPLICPECKTPHGETRTDGGYKVIKRFSGKAIAKDEYDKVILNHILETRHEWDRLKSFDGPFLKTVPQELKCAICSKLVDREYPGTFSRAHKKKVVCLECMMSHRWLLIDHKKI